MYLRHKCKDLKSMPSCCHYYWYDKQYTYILSVTYLDSCSSGMEVNLGNECKLLHLKKYNLDMYDLLMSVSTNISHSVPCNNFPLV